MSESRLSDRQLPLVIAAALRPEIRNIKPGQFVIGSFFASDHICEIRRAGYQTSCTHRQSGTATGCADDRRPLVGQHAVTRDGCVIGSPALNCMRIWDAAHLCRGGKGD